MQTMDIAGITTNSASIHLVRNIFAVAVIPVQRQMGYEKSPYAHNSRDKHDKQLQ